MTRWFVIALLFTGLAATLACGDDDDEGPRSTPTVVAQGGDGSPEAEYFTAWNVIQKDINTRIVANSDAYPGSFDGSLDDTKASFPIYVALFDEFIERVRDLDVPESMQDMVAESVAADEEINAINHERADLLAAATSYAEVDTIFADSAEFTAAYQRTVAACVTFQAKGVEHGIAFERECGS